MNDFTNLPGVFVETPNSEETSKKRIKNRSSGGFFERLRYLPPERWIDIVSCLTILAGLIAVFCCWDTVIAFLFYKIMFPLLKILSKIVAVAAGLLCLGGVASARLRRRRWYY